MRLTIIATALLAGATLQAGSFTLTSVDTNLGANVTFLNSHGVWETGFAGVILGTYNGTSVSPLFCVDLFTDIGYGTYTSFPLSPRVARKEDRAAWLYLNQLSTVASQDTGLAFQLAIWDIVHDGGDGLDTGLVSTATVTTLTPAQIALVNAYVAASAGQSATEGVSIYQNFAVSDLTPAQNLIGALAPGGNVPEPASMGLIGMGLCGLGAVWGRRRRA